jgi:hypothetical protein
MCVSTDLEYVQPYLHLWEYVRTRIRSEVYVRIRYVYVHLKKYTVIIGIFVRTYCMYIVRTTCVRTDLKYVQPYLHLWEYVRTRIRSEVYVRIIYVYVHTYIYVSIYT